jgi:hypothetical protein
MGAPNTRSQSANLRALHIPAARELGRSRRQRGRLAPWRSNLDGSSVVAAEIPSSTSVPLYKQPSKRAAKNVRCQASGVETSVTISRGPIYIPRDLHPQIPRCINCTRITAERIECFGARSDRSKRRRETRSPAPTRCCSNCLARSPLRRESASVPATPCNAHRFAAPCKALRRPSASCRSKFTGDERCAHRFNRTSPCLLRLRIGGCLCAIEARAHDAAAERGGNASASSQMMCG